ncbi:hypothetical protein AAE021_07895 [Arthrobacter citreus]|uniref:Uncharacterized protein n=1 Tax=Arthrobacter citreus TaxID=1670 RepID=A0ABZ3A222_9MICC
MAELDASALISALSGTAIESKDTDPVIDAVNVEVWSTEAITELFVPLTLLAVTEPAGTWLLATA